MSLAPHGILETSLYAEDLVQAERFYRDVLGLSVAARVEGRHVFFRCGHGMLLIFRPEISAKRPLMGAKLPVPPHGATGPGHVCFSAMADEFPRWFDRLKQNGVRVEADFTWPGGGRSVYFRDPAGNSIELAEPRIWALR